MRRLQTGDNVVVINGAHKGTKGTVKKVLKGESRVVVEGVNVVKRHRKATPSAPSGIVESEAPIDASNVMLVDPQTGKATRVRYQEREGVKVRVAKSGAVIPSRAVAG
ncbi:MAG TPA: 50S ribosomal protein L24 [Polyangiaceae bacterium]|jgi:large subunit ribosomal protein L24|nr:50S ribosomal protein L24 [Polyangiaceae bacterium]